MKLGVHTTSFKYRKMLCELYDEPADVLFAEQDLALTSRGEEPRLLAGYPELAAGLSDVVHGAERYLVVTGSRSRDVPYLDAIEEALTRRPHLVHYRVLFGPPRNEAMYKHLRRLLEIRDPEARPYGVKSLHIGLVDDLVLTPERFLCTSERSAIVPIPSLTSSEEFDSGVGFGPEVAARLIDHARQCYAGSRKVETAESIDDLWASRHLAHR